MDNHIKQRYVLDCYPAHIKRNFINLYKVEVTERLHQNVDSWHCFDTLLGENVTQGFVDTYKSSENQKSVTQSLYDRIINSDGDSFKYLMIFLLKADSELYRMMCVDDWEKESFVIYKKILNVLDRLLPVFDIHKVVEYLSEYSFELKRHYQPVIQRLENGEIDDEYAKTLIIRTLCILVDGAPYHLLYAIWRSSQEAQNVVESIYKNYDLFYLKNVFEDRDGIFHIVESYHDPKQAINEIMNSDLESPYSINVLFNQYIPPYHMVPLMFNTASDFPLNFRKYQHELAKPAMAGLNTIICAPTGSGKTIVAAYIIRNHIFEQRRLGKKVKVVFVVPKVILVGQQEAQMKKLLGSFNLSIQGIHGGHDLDFISAVQVLDIIILTPQLLVNYTNPRLCRYQGTDPILLDMFSLIVLDEAHHTNKSHSYRWLMVEYHKRKYSENNSILRPMPQVIGLSASLVSPKNDNVNEVIQQIIEVCANFDARCISRIRNRENIEEMNKFVSATKDEIIEVAETNLAIREYVQFIRDLSQYLKNEVIQIAGHLSDKFSSGGKDISNPQFIAWVSEMSNTVLPSLTMPPANKRHASLCLEYLDALYRANQCARCFPTKETTEYYLKNLEDEAGNEFERNIFAKMQQLKKLPNAQGENFLKLIEVINHQFSEKPDSRVIIFLPQRLYCQIAVEVIEQYTRKKAGLMASANFSTEVGGLNPVQQEENLRKFATGEYQILFTTSISDEGLDIPKCNLVIKYDFVTNNISHVQRKGRARDLASRSILITSDTRIRDREKKHIKYAPIAEMAYDRIDQIGFEAMHRWFEKEIAKYNGQIREEERAENAERERMAPFSDKYRILCRRCDAVLCDSSMTRACADYANLVGDPEFWNRVDLENLSANEYDKRKKCLGYILCSNVVDGTKCKKPVGCIVHFKNIVMPALACDAISFQEKATEIKMTKKKWKLVHQNLFYPKEITRAELMVMLAANPVTDPEILEEISNDSLEYYGFFEE